MATMNGKPWQYPTSGSNLYYMLGEARHHRWYRLQRISFQNIEKVFLAYTLSVGEELVMGKRSDRKLALRLDVDVGFHTFPDLV